jgi:hypothetical protein
VLRNQLIFYLISPHFKMPSPIEQLYYGRQRMTFRAGTYLALIRMMGLADLVTALYGRTALRAHTHARLGRTRETLRELICHGFESRQGRDAVARLRAAHAPLSASEEDYRYVLCTFFLEPIRWNAAYGWRRLSAQELQTLLAFWHQVGRVMGILDGEWSLAQWQAFAHDVEARRSRCRGARARFFAA